MPTERTSEIGKENKILLTLLTALLAAVSQQFIHILLLRRNGEDHRVTRFREVDDNDFKTAMLILDLLTSRGVPIEIDNHIIAPGLSTPSILRSEQKMEQYLAEVTHEIRLDSADGNEILRRVSMLRGNYQAWLAQEVGSLSDETSSDDDFTEQPALYSLLLLLMEQTLVHAFMEWHRGNPNDANTAWQISGAAMLYITALAKFYGSDASNYSGIIIPCSVFNETVDLFQSSINLVQECGEAARRLKQDTDDLALSRLSHRIAMDCDRIARTQKGNSIDADLGKSNVFRSFTRALKRMNS